MSEKDLREIVHAVPFVPVRLQLSNGASYDLTHPDSILLSKRMAAVAVGDSLKFVSLLHINEVEPLPTVRA
jgi:hypothetical protein